MVYFLSQGCRSQDQSAVITPVWQYCSRDRCIGQAFSTENCLHPSPETNQPCLGPVFCALLESTRCRSCSCGVERRQETAESAARCYVEGNRGRGLTVVVDRRSVPLHVRRRAAPAAARPRGLPHVYQGGSRGGRKSFDADRAFGPGGGRFRWLLSTCLAGGVGAIAILVVVYGSMDGTERLSLKKPWKPTWDSVQQPTPTARQDDGLKWAVPKADRLQMTAGAASTRFIIHDSLRVKKASREYIHAKPYARIVARLAPVPPSYADVIPPFNPFKLYATDRGTQARAIDGQTSTDVSIKVVELMGGILPGEDGQELDAQEVVDLVARNREAAGAALKEAASTTTADPTPVAAAAAEDPLPYHTTRLTKSTFELDDAADGDLEKRQVRVIKVGRADTLTKILQQAGADQWQAKEMAETAKGLIPDGALIAGQEVRITMVPSLTQSGRSEPARFSVFSDGHEHKVTVTRNSAGGFVASATPFEQQLGAPETAGDSEQGQLSSLYASFYAAGLLQNVPAETIQQMLRVHAYETDFRRRVRGNDVVEMFFDMRDDSTPDSPPGELLFTGISGSGITGRFWRFRSPDGLVDFYDEQGNNSKRFLMRKPIRSDDVRLTSGFGLRFHPLFNDRRMHTGIDWSGAIGTPVVAAGSGVVEEALYKGGNGRYVRLRHANGYQTTYSHMSGFARGIEPGMKVRQGQIIGFLGNSGYSTGPHLHFEILVNSRFVDPLAIQVPRERQLTGKQLAEFQKERARIDELMRRTPVMTQTR
jgi:murein DD-endopeptidase MepM/ murein hydrolase activator NlpD